MASKFGIIDLAATVLVSAASASLLFPRNNPPQPPCVYPYTPFVYSGCYTDSVFSRSLPFQAELEFNNATVEQCTSYCKGNDYRYAGLQYYGQCFCGASVASAAAPEEDCNLPCNGDNTQACGGQDRLSIYQDPTFPDADAIAISDDYLSLGCYTEGTSGRSLDYSQYDFLDADTMTTETCLNACGSKGYPFAGLEFGRECYCGVVLGNGTVPADSAQCVTLCTGNSGNSTQYCGGEDHLSLYVAKSLESTEPCEPPIISSSSTESSTTSTASSSYSSPSTTSSKPTTSSTKSSSSKKSSSTTCWTTTTTTKKSSTKTTSTKSLSKTTSSAPKTTTTSTKKTTTTSTKSSSKTTSTPKTTSTKKNPWGW